MSVSFTGALALWNVLSIPVKAHPVVSDSMPELRNLHTECSTPISHKSYCAHCQREVDKEHETCKGVQSGGQWIRLTDEDEAALDAPIPEKGRPITIHQTLKPEEITFLWQERVYYLEPASEQAMRPYAFLSRSLRDEKVYAVVTYISHTKTHLGVIMPSEHGLLLRTLHFHSALRSLKDIEGDLKQVALSAQEVQMGRQVMRKLYRKFEHASYENEAEKRLRQVIQARLEKTALPPVKAEPMPRNVVQLMQALKVSLRAGEVKAAQARS